MDAFRTRVKVNIEKSFRENNVNALVTIDTRTKNIEISGEDMNAWIRLTVIPTRNSKVKQVDINNIQINPTKQQKRIFTNMMLNLRELKTVDRIIITSVCTSAMKCWCTKNGCRAINPYDYQYK